MSSVILWDYPKSSASYRVRIALNLAGINYEARQVDLLSGDHRDADHLARNPQGLVPVLDIDGLRLTQSLAMLEYLDRTRALGLLPEADAARAQHQALAYTLAVDVHPVCNLSVMRAATGGEEPARSAWMARFIGPGLRAFEALVPREGRFAGGARPGLADLCLIPQLFNAKRWNVAYDDCPRICEIEAACAELAAFAEAHPSRASDYGQDHKAP